MTAFISYSHPSLALGRVVDHKVLSLMNEIGAMQRKSDAAFDKMNALIALRRSMKMTMEELIGMDIEAPDDIATRLAALDASVKAAAQSYITQRLASDTQMETKLVELAEVDAEDALDSPVDFELTQTINQPVGSDSMRLDMQYFSYGETDEDASATVIRISDAIRKMTEDVGTESNKMARTANQQLNEQIKSHELTGTLVIAATCTHRNALMLSPLFLDADRLLEIWNQLQGEGTQLDTSDLPRMAKIAHASKGGADAIEGSIPLLVGTNLGSSFVGMVHTVSHDEFEATRQAEDVTGMEDMVRLGNWLSGMSGQIGMDREVGKEIRNMAGHKRVFAHVNIIAMGVVPTFVADEKAKAAKQALQQQVPRSKQLLNDSDQGSGGRMDSGQPVGQSARLAAQLASIDGQMTANLLEGLGKLDVVANQTLDINSMMTAFDNYIASINKSNSSDNKTLSVGVPIGYHVRRIGASTVARLWLDKYFPGFSPLKTHKAATDAASKPAPGGAAGPQRRAT